MSDSERRHRRRVLRPMLVLAALVALAIVLVPTGSAKPPASAIKLYQVCLTAGDGTSPCTSWNSSGGALSTVTGSPAEMQITIHNDKASNQSLGSANVTVPAGLGLSIDRAASATATNYSTYASTSTSTTLQLRNLNLAANGQVTVAFYVDSTSTCGEGTWGIQVKQSNDFNGSGNDFSPPTASSGLTSIITGGCHLAWIDQPASANQSTPITDTAFTSSGANVHSVTVALEDSSNAVVTSVNTGTATLAVNGSFDPCGTGCNPGFTGLTSTTFQNGQATFPSFQSAYTGVNFTATATALGLTTPTSSPPFVIQTNGKDCTGQDPCDLSGTAGNGLVDILGSGGNFVYLALSSASVPSEVLLPGGGCTNFTGTGTDFRETDARDGSGNLTVTLSITNQGLKTAYGPNYGQPNVPICVGVKYLVGNTAYPCTDPVNGGFAWPDRALPPPTGTLGSTWQGAYGPGAVCDTTVGSTGYGYWWGIVGTFQDPNPPFDPTTIPLITGWGSVGNFRTFTISVPSDWDMQGHG